MKEKLKALLSALGVVALGVVGSIVLSRWFGTVEVAKENVQSIKLATGESQVDDRTYVSIQHGFSLRLPAGYDMIESATGADVAASGGPRVMTIVVSATKPKKASDDVLTYTDGRRYFILTALGGWPEFRKTAESFKAVIESR